MTATPNPDSAFTDADVELIAKNKFKSMGEHDEPTKEKWLHDLMLVHFMLGVLKYDDEGLAERWRSADQETEEAMKVFVSDLIAFKDRTEALCDLLDCAVARQLAAANRVCCEENQAAEGAAS